ncbi:MAG TPA: DinB family protein [Thermomicrobiales bacterium]|nr:DinB family protein [Thermomicrobiales bacterium]
MNDGLLDAFHHNAWATRELLRVCRGLTEAQLRMTAPGTYGSSIATLRHLVASEAGYCRRLTGEEPAWYGRADDEPGLDELAGRGGDLAARWERFLAQPFDAERTFVVAWHDGADRDVPAGVYLAQALHHGNEHRAQICTVLTSIGVTTPDLGVWDYAEATNRARRRES